MPILPNKYITLAIKTPAVQSVEFISIFSTILKQIYSLHPLHCLILRSSMGKRLEAGNILSSCLNHI